jgi:formylglycine-generating enzyme required for sulfatase activity
VLQLCQALQPKTIPADAVQIRAQEEVARQVVEESRKRQKRQALWSLLSLVSLVGLAGFAAWWMLLRSNEKAFNTMIKIPAGEFTYQNGEKVNLPDFWIDEHEVTIGQYAKFLQYLEAHPDEAVKFDHSNQPKGKSHKPANWEIYYGRAKAGKPVKFIPIDLNCPIFLVDWWDAYAYAKWKGRRLPTEQEWEKAARGTDGRVYPWGNEWDPKKCNSNADYSENPNDAGSVDGYNRWAPVDATGADKSPYGVIGMAGNLSEWTGTWDEKGKFPVVRGGNYHSADNKVTRRVAELDPEGTSEYLGFRTASDQPASGQ